jgi:predicted DNA-binding transcriptional regulator AlpA
MKYVNTTKAALIIGLSPHTLSSLRCRGGGPRFVKIGRRAVRYEVEELERWMRERTRSSTSDTGPMALAR